MKKFDPAALSEFARYYGFHYDQLDPMGLVEDVIFEMDRGLKNQASSMAMIPAYISPAAKLNPGKTVMALDAGGTNLRAALIQFDENGKVIEGQSNKVPMPGTQGQLNADAYFDAIADAALPLLKSGGSSVEGIGFCFSYPMDITEDADGILLKFSKEVDAPEVIGKAIGKGLREALARKGVKAPERIVLLNDTVATLLSGIAELPAHGGLREGEDRYGVPSGPMVGYILGTGVNTAYPECNIPKIGFHDEKNPQIIVCESGNFAHRYMGFLDKEYDSGTNTPGSYTLEKCTAGAYLGPLTFHILKRAVADGLLDFAKAKEFCAWPTMQAKDLNPFMHAPLAKEGPVAALFGDDELDALRTFVYLTSIVTERGALLSAAVVAGTVIKASEGYDPFVPVRIAVEGTTYVRYKGMRRALESYLHLMLNRGKPRSYSISPVGQASLFGAAVAALSK